EQFSDAAGVRLEPDHGQEHQRHHHRRQRPRTHHHSARELPERAGRPREPERSGPAPVLPAEQEPARGERRRQGDQPLVDDLDRRRLQPQHGQRDRPGHHERHEEAGEQQDPPDGPDETAHPAALPLTGHEKPSVCQTRPRVRDLRRSATRSPATTLSASPRRNGTTPSCTARTGSPRWIASWATPPARIVAAPAASASATRVTPQTRANPRSSRPALRAWPATTPVTNAAAGKASRYPPVGPSKCANPAKPPWKTGIPMTPAARYVTWDAAPSRGPRSAPARITTSVCIVTGTGMPGSRTTTYALNAVSTAKTATPMACRAPRRATASAAHARAFTIASPISDPLHGKCDGIPAAETERRQTGLRVPVLHCVQQRGQDPRARRTDRVAERDRATVHVHAVP